MGYANLTETNREFNAVFTTTLRNYRKKFEDNVFRQLPLLWYLTKKGKKRVESGGFDIIVPLLYGENNTVRMYSGYDLMDTTPQEGITAARYSWKQMAASISISGKEERQNAGPAKLISLLQTKIMQAEKSMQWVLNDCLHGRFGTGLDGTQGYTYGDDASDYDSIGDNKKSTTGFNSLDNFVRFFQGMVGPTSGSAYAHTVGGITVTLTPGATRSDYTDIEDQTEVAMTQTNAWWMNKTLPGYGKLGRNGALGPMTSHTVNGYAGDIDDISTANKLIGAMRKMYNILSDGSEHPDVGLAVDDVFEYYEANLVPNERYQNTAIGDAGFQNLKFKGMTLMTDSGIVVLPPDAVAVATPGSPLYMLNSDYLEWVTHRDADFTTTPFQRPADQDARVAQILLMGNLTCSNRGKQGVIQTALNEDFHTT